MVKSLERTYSPNTNSRRAVNRLLADGGLLPIEVLVGSMRWFIQEAAKAWVSYEKEEDPVVKAGLYSKSLMLRRDSIFCAREAAPFMHSRIAQVAYESGDGNNKTIFQIDAVDAGL